MSQAKDKCGIAVFISGRGSNLANLISVCESEGYPARIDCVISDNHVAAGVEIAQNRNIPTFLIGRGNHKVELGFILKDFDIKLICLAGFMQILRADFVELWKGKIINIHPSLLPAFRGLNAQKQALLAKVKIAGCTVHYVNNKMDDGEIIMQAAVPVLEDDTVDSLSARILKAEHECYPRALKYVLDGKSHDVKRAFFVN